MISISGVHHCTFWPRCHCNVKRPRVWNVVGWRPGFLSSGPSLFFFQFSWVVFREPRPHEMHTHLLCANAARQTAWFFVSLTAVYCACPFDRQLCNAQMISCDYSFDKRVDKTYFRVKIRFRVFFYSQSTTCCCGRRHWALPEVTKFNIESRGVFTPLWRGVDQSRQGLVFVADGSCGRPVSRARSRTDRCGQRRGLQPKRASADDLLVSPPRSCGLRPTWVRRRAAASVTESSPSSCRRAASVKCYAMLVCSLLFSVRITSRF